MINGEDIEEIDTAGLRKRISAIFQDFIKYPFTAEENITISDLENANDLHRLSKVIDDAGAAEVIDGLPHRLQTQLQKGWNGGTGKKLQLPGAFLSKVMCTCLMNLFRR